MKFVIIPFIKIFLQVLLFTGLFFSTVAQSSVERVWPIITFTCDKSKNEVKIKNEVKWGAAGKNFPFNAQQGTYNPWSLVAFEDRGKRRLISEKSQLNLSCQLGNSHYRFQIKPKIFNTNFNAKCGDRLSVIVSVYKNDSLLVENRAMEAFCHGNSPVLKGIKIKGGKAKFYEVPRSRFY